MLKYNYFGSADETAGMVDCIGTVLLVSNSDEDIGMLLQMGMSLLVAWIGAAWHSENVKPIPVIAAVVIRLIR